MAAIFCYDLDQLPPDATVRLLEDAGLVLSAEIGQKVLASRLLRFCRRYVDTYGNTTWLATVDDVLSLICDDVSVRGEAVLYLTGRAGIFVFKRERINHAVHGPASVAWFVRTDGTVARMVETDGGDRFVEDGTPARKATE